MSDKILLKYLFLKPSIKRGRSSVILYFLTEFLFEALHTQNVIQME